MRHPYKVIVSNNSIHREFEIHEDMEKVLLGTNSSCEFRLNAEDFFAEIELAFILQDDQWYALCNDVIYLNSGDIRKLNYRAISHGDSLQVRYADNGSVAFNIVFVIDFEVQMPIYNIKIDTANRPAIIIGSESSNPDIVLRSDYCNDTYISLKFDGKRYWLEEKKSNYGVNANGTRITQATELKDYDFFSISDVFFYLNDGCLYSDDNKVTVKGLYTETLEKSVFKYPVFVRNTRRKVELDTTPIKILDPSQKPTKPELNIITSLLPMVMMLVLIIVVRGFMTTTAGGFIIFSACSMGLGIVTSIISMVQGRRKYKKEIDDRQNVYTKYIEEKETEIEEAREIELSTLKELYRGQAESIEKVLEFDSDIFDRVPEDNDYMNILLGYGKKKAERVIEYKKQEKLEENDDLAVIPEQIEEKYRYIENAPIYIQLRETNAIGITGTSEDRYEFFKIILADLICRQFSNEMEFFLLTDKDVDNYDWIKRLPQLRRDDGKRNIVFDSDTRTNSFDYLYKELSSRAENKNVTGKNIVVFTLDNNGIYNHPISKYIQNAGKLNATFIFFESSVDYLPLYCSEIVELTGEGEGEWYGSEDRTKQQSFRYSEICDDVMKELVEKIAPVCSEEVSLASSLRKNYSMFEMLGIYNASDIDLGTNWATSEVYKSMAAPIGINSKNDIVELDLHEKAHGPHGLVAGTTGSGKSEMLQTYILSMAVKYHPYEVSFVIIDFKGGGMANQIAGLPHLVGTITNIDGKQIDRSLKSIKAELLKRQTLFADAGVNHIDKYIASFKAKEISTPLPHLIIIVDEFAELKAEQPEFMKELISTSRIGRSLGVHLILATQKPSGQVNEQIWSNSRFKLCLKVQDQQDSNEVIKSPVAAEIKEPGRAYLQVGNNEIFELLQSGYSGGPVFRIGSEDQSFSIYEEKISGRGAVFYDYTPVRKQLSSETELESLIRIIRNFCKENDIARLDPICMPPLDDIIEYIPQKTENGSLELPLGVYDDPDYQKQDTFTLDIGKDNTFIVGSSQMGKTNILQLVVRHIAENYSPNEASIYIADFGSLQLKKYEKLAHVGGVVTPKEEEKLGNLLKLLLNELTHRKELFLKNNVTSYSAYLETGARDLPHIVFIVDNLTALKELYLEDDDSLLQICRDGLSLGISVIVANSSTTGIGYKYLSVFANRIALYCNDSGEYNSLFDFCHMKIDAIPGRCIVNLNKNHYECQAFKAYVGSNELESTENIINFIEQKNKIFGGEKAKSIPEVPEEISVDYLAELSKESVVLGINYSSVEPFCLNISKHKNPIVITGNDMHRQNMFMTFLINRINDMYNNKRIFIIDNLERELQQLGNLKNVEFYSYISEDAEKVVEAVEQCVKKRYKTLSTGGNLNLNQTDLIVMAINSNDAMEHISSNNEIMNMYKNIINKYKSMNVCVILANFENTSINYSSPEVMRLARDSGQFFLFDSIDAFKILDIPMTTVREYKNKQSIDDFFYIKGDSVDRIKTFNSRCS